MLAVLAARSTSFQLSKISQSRRIAANLQAVSKKQTFIYDGGELQSFLIHANESLNYGRQQVGCITFVTGTTRDSKRVIGVHTVENEHEDRETISLGDTNVYKDTVAEIPSRVSDEDALSTAASSVVGVHCALPVIEELGGGDNEIFYSGKAVVMGANRYACFVADGLATLGIDVSLVSTGGAKANESVNIMQPSVDIGEEDDVGFASAIGEFDSLIDTVENERKGASITEDNPSAGGSSVLALLRSRHKCKSYISTVTQAQQILRNEGVFFGPGKANDHIKKMQSLSSRNCKQLVPIGRFGPSTLQPLLQADILFSTKNTNPTAVRGWSLKEFWEAASWPRDSDSGSVRFGLPVIEEDDLDFNRNLEKLMLAGSEQRTRVGGEGGLDKKEEKTQTLVDNKNPYVTQIQGIDGLAETIISQRRDCCIFVAMRSCRTCKSMNPIYTRMARESYLAREGNNGVLMFAKADASGNVGKTLGKQLGIISVPSFVLFRKGVRYGAVSATKLPSEKLDRAIQLCVTGADFDPSLEDDEND